MVYVMCYRTEKVICSDLQSPAKKSTKETKMIENSLFLTYLPTKNYTFTGVLYSFCRTVNCTSLNCTINTILPKWNACLNSSKWTDENTSNENVDHK